MDQLRHLEIGIDATGYANTRHAENSVPKRLQKRFVRKQQVFVIFTILVLDIIFIRLLV